VEVDDDGERGVACRRHRGGEDELVVTSAEDTSEASERPPRIGGGWPVKEQEEAPPDATVRGEAWRGRRCYEGWTRDADRRGRARRGGGLAAQIRGGGLAAWIGGSGVRRGGGRHIGIRGERKWGKKVGPTPI